MSVAGDDPGLTLGPLDVGPIAHGGHCVARDDGRVVFVRHALPGERVEVRITDASQPRYWRGDAVTIEQASPVRVAPPCPIAGPGLCGGCDLQHARLEAQRELKRTVVAEQLRRLGGIAWLGTVEPLAGRDDGLGWRTRMRYVVGEDGRLGMRRHRSHEVIPLPDGGCRIAHPDSPLPQLDAPMPGTEVVVNGVGDQAAVLVDGRLVAGSAVLHERAAGREWEVAADGFWQVHPAAADTFVAAVLDGLLPTAGETALDLYCGVGLFAGALVDAGCAVWGVEESPEAIEWAARNVPQATFRVGKVHRVLARLPGSVDLVVLDPPRTGAGREVVAGVAARRPRGIAYVACDPAALGRDLGWFADEGYVTTSVRAFDAFPMTHHVECVAILVPEGAGRGSAAAPA